AWLSGVTDGAYRPSIGHGDIAFARNAARDGRGAGWRRPVWRGPVGQPAAGSDRRVARQGGGSLCPEWHDGEPDRAQDPDPAGGRGDPRRRGPYRLARKRRRGGEFRRAVLSRRT